MKLWAKIFIGLIVVAKIGDYAVTLLTRDKEGLSFVDSSILPVIATWDSERLVPLLAESYGVAWTQNDEKKSEFLSHVRSNLDDVNRVFNQARINLGFFKQKDYAYCVDVGSQKRCTIGAIFEKGRAEIQTHVADEPNTNRDHKVELFYVNQEK